jgi:hypothetical protein
VSTAARCSEDSLDDPASPKLNALAVARERLLIEHEPQVRPPPVATD